MQLSILICSEKSNILKKKKWGLLFNFLGTNYDKDPYYNPAGVNVFHPNTTRVPIFSGQDEFNQILTNDTLTVSVAYNDYCSQNDCVANDSLSEIWRFDNSLNGISGTTIDGNGTFQQGVFGGNSGAYNSTANIVWKINSTNTATNLTGVENYGFGGWFNFSVAVGFYPIFNNFPGVTDVSYELYINPNTQVFCAFRNSTNPAINTRSTASKSIAIGLNGWHFLYCQKDSSQVCVYVDDAAPTCSNINAGEVGGSMISVWSSGAGSNMVQDELQFRKIALNNANISQLYYDGLHRLRPNDFTSNNSLCEFYIQNSSGLFNVKNQTLSFNVTTCTLNSADTMQFKAGNNIRA